MHRLGIDIGGTFTDAALESDGRRFTTKVLTNAAAPERSVLEAIAGVLAGAKVKPSALSLIIHGTTLATNALIERKGARTALITTEGFRDTIEIRHENRFEQYDVSIDLPPPLVPRRWRFGVRERIDARGKVLIPLDEAAVEGVIGEIERAELEAVAVGFLHSFTQPAHEQRIGEMLAKRLPHVAVTLSCEVSPEMREYERFSTACANAYLQPMIATYLAKLRGDLDTAGVNCPLFLMLSGGGLTTIETAMRFPVRLVESGPAGGAIFASHIARQCGFERVVSFDMGGTTAKICLIDEFKPQTNRAFEVARMYRFKKGSGLPLRVPVIDMVEIGAGGGSIARLDALRRICVGPDSAGAEPGPACYGRGGTAPTVTDADLLLGRIDAAAFSGGRMALAPAAAEAALDDAVAKPLDLTLMVAALGVSEMVDENMSNAARVHAIESGKDMRGRVLIAFGGAAPLHVARVAEKLGIDRILIPTSAGVGSAVGFLRAPISYEIVRSRLARLSRINVADINALFSDMRKEAEAIVRRGAPDAALIELRHAFMRYRGQGHEVLVPLPGGLYGENDSETFARAFETAYRTLYKRSIPGVEIEVVSWVLSLCAPADTRAETPEAVVPHGPDAAGQRSLFDLAAEFIQAMLYRRRDMRPGARIRGPAIIIEDETSTVVSPAFDAVVNGFGYIELIRKISDQ
jgi:N-methylhydantoinase A